MPATRSAAGVTAVIGGAVGGGDPDTGVARDRRGAND